MFVVRFDPGVTYTSKDFKYMIIWWLLKNNMEGRLDLKCRYWWSIIKYTAVLKLWVQNFNGNHICDNNDKHISLMCFLAYPYAQMYVVELKISDVIIFK